MPGPGPVPAKELQMAKLLDIMEPFDQHLAAIQDLYKRWEENKRERPGQGLVLNERDEEILSGFATQITEVRASFKPKLCKKTLKTIKKGP